MCQVCVDTGVNIHDVDWRDPLDANRDGEGGTANGKPIFTLDQVIANLNRTSYPGTDIGGPGWNLGEYGARTQSGTSELRFGFYDATTIDAQPYRFVDANGNQVTRSQFTGFREFSDAQKAAAREAIGLWDDLIVNSIVETPVGEADITFGNYTNQPGTQAYAYLPYDYGGSSAGLQGDSWYNGLQASNLQLDFGFYGKHTLQHEIGHTLGLQHPGAYNAAPGRSITYAANAEYFQDSRQYSIMSYFNADVTGAAQINWQTLTFVYPQTPMVHDVATVQAMYGADTTTRTGGTVYGFNSTAGKDVFDFTKNVLPIITIYDAGGDDTLDFSGFTSNTTIDLAPGAFSSGGGTGVVPLADLKARGVLPQTYTQAQYDALRARYNAPDGLLHDNISIAYGTIIENAIGGAGNDTIRGNDVGNRLEGRDGNDTIYGLGGDDVLQGQAGNDTLYGGDGDDRLYGNEGDDTLYGDAGNDQLYGGDGADTLYGGEGDDRVYGEAGADKLYGGAGNDLLDGGEGADTMEGGVGDDIYYVDDQRDYAYERPGQGTDEIRTTVGFALTNNIENMLMLGTANIDGRGNELDNRMIGNSGNNYLRGFGGNDILQGMDGDDTLNGGIGDDLLVGGNGQDTVSFKLGATVGARVDLSITGAQDTGYGSDTLRSIENAEGTEFNDVLLGDNNANVISGLAGDDVIRGRGGNDTLMGGDGVDQFLFERASLNGVDTIVTFQTGVDKLLFDTADGYAAGAGFSSGKTAVATTAGAQFIYDLRDKALYYDADGAGGAAATKIAIMKNGDVKAGDIQVGSGLTSSAFALAGDHHDAGVAGSSAGVELLSHGVDPLVMSAGAPLF